MQYLLILALVIAVLSVVFALQNAVVIPVSLLVWEVRSSLALVLLVTLALGIVVGLLAMAPSLIKRSIKISQQHKKIKQLQEAFADKEVSELPQRLDSEVVPREDNLGNRLAEDEI